MDGARPVFVRGYWKRMERALGAAFSSIAFRYVIQLA